MSSYSSETATLQGNVKRECNVCLLVKEPYFIFFYLLKVFHSTLLNEEKPYCTSLFLPFFQYNMDKAIVDSGTTLLRLPVKVFSAVVEAITRSSLVRYRLPTDNDETHTEQRDAGEDWTHSLFKDVVALSGRIRVLSLFCYKICVHAFVFFCFTIFTFWSCTQTIPKVNLNLEATFSINIPTFLQINPKWENRMAKPFLALYWPCVLPLSLSVWFVSRTFLQGSGKAPSLHAGWRERPTGGFSPSCPSIWGPQTPASPFV